MKTKQIIKSKIIDKTYTKQHNDAIVVQTMDYASKEVFLVFHILQSI